MDINFTPTALRQWTQLDKKVRAQISKKIHAFAASGAGNLKRLQGRPESRLRMGDWRVIFVVENNTMLIVAVGNRRDIYD
ncbi:MAG: type II toxin-antitoxin system RelE/ParE family toxin [Rhodopseudomonas sp.]|nr:type II toxin-antitoxin system RelE/ParE family toxin [Rhodopseudomonas sp.]